ncbi:tRNA (adenosine(37)-N6)-dimethylallyltransferase MiaA [Candidatus Kirkpatrickella diaphorinae]|uniref:tRNA dimethylallyltransferase n=1 Tax=Candidatus Kirkpatrickella diaphorinae TaxID=2984322 RepID=A0ABY6GI39_9PROT|nr:tRNA (adenosine(37)-N6)-dimethylallyltransferase MiaA [Candidatus Kirkpatrickella diaphorinae]UYH50994.1 tRNA (adenosine(37)-N6)-dimethylallyltransferase MiaA [Candidatus Kirkpatrickella diaphorinae]
MQHTPTALIVAGPTCSGKSALAFSLAQLFDGVIINADSMQVYRDLRILTARPSEAEMQAVPHRLYGILDAAENGSVAWWRRHALDEMDAALALGKLPIFCGGTGMYLRALIEGLVEVPDPGPEARAEAREKLAAEGPESLYAALQAIDPDAVSRIAPSDGQRLARVWEVWRGTGETLSWWRRESHLPAASCRFIALRLDPPRDALRAAIAARFDVMLDHGAIEEVTALRARNLPPSLPAMRAHGVPELIAFLDGKMTLAMARERATLATGQYTRRQATWFRHHELASAAQTYNLSQRFDQSAQFSERTLEDLEIFIRARLTRC